MSRANPARVGAVLLLGSLAALAVLGPAWTGEELVGLCGADLHGSLWHRWHLRWLLGGGSPTSALGWPDGYPSLLAVGGNQVAEAISGLWAWGLGSRAAHNLWSATVLLANIGAFWWLAQRWCARAAWAQGVACMGALSFGLSPFVLQELAGGRPVQAMVFWLPLLLHRGLDLGERKGAWWQSGLLLACLAWTDWYGAVWGGLLLTGVGLHRAPRATLQALALALVACLPLLGTVAWGLHQGGEAAGLDPSGLQDRPVFALGLDGTTVDRAAVHPAPPELGRVMGLEALWGLPALVWLGWRRRGEWLGLGLATALALILALGPTLPGSLPNPVYWAASSLFPPLARLGFPVRAAGLVGLGAISAGTALAARAGGPWRVLVLALGVSGGLTLVGWELAPVPTCTAAPSPTARTLAAQAPAAVLALPPDESQRWMVHQITHGLPVQARPGGDRREPGPADAPVAALERWAHDQGGLPTHQAGPLRDLGFGFLLWDRGAPAAPGGPGQRDHSQAVQALHQWLGPALHDDGTLVVWALPAGARP